MTGIDIGVPGLVSIAELGRGGSARVYSAVDPSTGQELAVKVLSSTLKSGQAEGQFQKELRSLEALRTVPGVVAVLSHGTSATGDPYLVMPLLSGGSCQDLLAGGVGLPWDEAATIVAKACAAIQASHDLGIWHRDIKPANILRTGSGETFVSDFGIAQFSDGSGQPKDGGSLTPNYAAPEVFARNPERLSDIYSLGATLAALVLARPPFSAPGQPGSPVAIMQRVLNDPPPDLTVAGAPARLSAVAAKAMAKDSAHRHQSAEELRAELLTVLGSEGQEPGVQQMAAAQNHVLAPHTSDPVDEQEWPEWMVAAGASSGVKRRGWTAQAVGAAGNPAAPARRYATQATPAVPIIRLKDLPSAPSAAPAATGPPTRSRQRSRRSKRPLVVLVLVAAIAWLAVASPWAEMMQDGVVDLVEDIRRQVNSMLG